MWRFWGSGLARLGGSYVGLIEGEYILVEEVEDTIPCWIQGGFGFGHRRGSLNTRKGVLEVWTRLSRFWDWGLGWVWWLIFVCLSLGARDSEVVGR